VRVVERRQLPLRHRLCQGKRVPPLKMDRAMRQGREPRAIFRIHLRARVSQLLERLAASIADGSISVPE